MLGPSMYLIGFMHVHETKHKSVVTPSLPIVKPMARVLQQMVASTAK